MHVATRIFLLGVVDEGVHIAREPAIAASGVRIEPASCLDGYFGCLLHSLHGKFARCADKNDPLTAQPGDDGRPVIVIVVPALVAAGSDVPMREAFQLSKPIPI